MSLPRQFISAHQINKCRQLKPVPGVHAAVPMIVPDYLGGNRFGVNRIGRRWFEGSIGTGGKDLPQETRPVHA